MSAELQIELADASRRLLEFSSRILELQLQFNALASELSRDGWEPVREGNLPPLDLPVWLREGDFIWIGARTDGPDGWLWGRCYHGAHRAAGKWRGEDCEQDDYHPTHWKRLPEMPV